MVFYHSNSKISKTGYSPSGCTYITCPATMAQGTSWKSGQNDYKIKNIRTSVVKVSPRNSCINKTETGDSAKPSSQGPMSRVHMSPGLSGATQAMLCHLPLLCGLLHLTALVLFGLSCLWALGSYFIMESARPGVN